MQQQAIKPVSLLAAGLLVAAAAFTAQHAHASGMQRDFLARVEPLLASGKPARADARASRVEAAPRAPQRIAREGETPRPAREASASTPAANLFRFEPSESWIPSAAAPKRARRPAVGGFFGGFTE
jgi:outer membrane murein-binding lipoprotein Lpp